jgi:hypothetical protein
MTQAGCLSAPPATIPRLPPVAVGGIARMARLLAVAGVLFLATTAGAPQGEEARGIASGQDAGVEGAGSVKRSSRAVVSSMTLEDDEMSDEPLILELPSELQVSLDQPSVHAFLPIQRSP